MTKICSKCKIEKSVEEYHRCASAPDGRQHACKDCAQSRNKEYRKTEKFKSLKVGYDRRFRESLIVGTAKWWKVKYGYNRVRDIYIGATWEQLKLLYENNPTCSYCGVSVGPEEIHFDHRQPRSRGGETGISNICVSCQPCNQLKWKMTVEEFHKFQLEYALRVLRHRNVNLDSAPDHRKEA